MISSVRISPWPELEKRVGELVHAVYGGRVAASPEWLNRPGRSQCGRRWRMVERIYEDLAGCELLDPFVENSHLVGLFVRH
jgi:hypothetical protein